MMTTNNTKLLNININLSNLNDNSNILSYKYRIDQYCTDKNIIDHILANPEDAKFRLENENYMLFAVTTSNVDGKVKYNHIVPCFMYKDDMCQNTYRLIHIPENLFRNMYDVNNKYIDFMFDVRNRNTFFMLPTDVSDEISLYGKIKIDPEDSVKNIHLFFLYKDAESYRKNLVDKIHLEKKIADERHANNTWTVDEIAKKLGISVTDLKIVDDDNTYYDGTCPENYGELDNNY